MSLHRLHHFNIVTEKIDETAAWFERTMGFRNGDRPKLSFSGYWMYLGDTPVVHIASENPSAAVTGEEPHAARGALTGPIDHIAFVGDDFEGFRAGLVAKNVDHFHVYLEDIKLNQLFLRDPNGILIEINFAE
jgi:catechol 2,3-dioxygenase-like lactoylglutathione lyase family enzyme